MEIEITLEKEDWWQFQSNLKKQLFKQQKNWTDNLWINMALWTLMTALLMIGFQYFSDFHWPTAGYVLAIVILIEAAQYMRRLRWRKTLAPVESGIFCGGHKYTFSDAEIISEGDGHQARYSWGIVKKVERDGGMILIYLDTINALAFPETKLTSPNEFYEYVSWQSRKGADQTVAA